MISKIASSVFIGLVSWVILSAIKTNPAVAATVGGGAATVCACAASIKENQ